MTVRRRTVAAGVLFLLSTTIGVAQSDLGQGYFQLGQSMMSTGMMNNVLANNVRNARGNRPRNLREDVLPDTSFRRIPDVTKRVEHDYAEWLGKRGNPEASRELRTYFATHDFRQDWAKNEASDGLRPDNVADALTAYWVMNWMIANKVNGTTRAQVQAVKRQIAPAILRQKSFTSLNNVGRQQLAEIWQLNYVFQSVGMFSAMKKGDQAMVQKASDAAEARFQNEAKVDLRAIKITDHGFVKA